MSNIVYLTVAGEQQGSISAGCGTSESTGNRWQSGHEDEIFTFSLLNNINNTGLGSQFHGITFCKLIDKSTPLFINSINNNEQLFMGFDFYRINRFGRLEKYYYIQLRGAFLSAIHHQIIENQLDTETITISYEFILCQHLIANTEFSYLALPENYNRLFLPNSKNQANNRFKTLNSKAIGRLLAAGGVYNGNIEGFRDTAEKLGGDAIKGYDQILNEKTAGIAIATASILLTKRSNVDTYTEINSYLGKLRGQQKLLDGIDIIEIIYIKRPSKDLANLRKEFNKTVRKNFLIKLAKTSEASGRFNAEDLLRMRKGNVPLNYNVHHKLSLDDGGTNDFENLVLIENEPYHKVFTNMQSRIAKGILVGESKITPWAILSGSIYPPMKNIMDHTK
ncbi:Hcp1 family type VI secretion system effector [Escherichia coli]|nr:Hcp1 family type VI secretion system effector [Escherichia coli]MDY8468854.1 Hcp1 family type VI secretion system effector [Escherichia coli]MDY8487227.1 Hcp1 family type VI secretion system effector [Escherichia coli]